MTARDQTPLAIIDIDGVVADVSHRLHFLSREPKNWKDFFAAGRYDKPLSDGVDAVRLLAQDHQICWLTGRPERVRADTEHWLTKHGLTDGPLAGAPLFMRADGDGRPARKAKLEAVTRLRTEFSIGIVLDDDPAVITTLTSAGFPCRLADWLPYSNPLRDAQNRHGRT